MKSLFKIFTILTPKQLRQCAFIVFAMVIGAMLEAVGIGAILPLISIMGQPDFLERHEQLGYYTGLIGIESYTEFIIFCAVCLIGIYILKNIYMAWQTRLQIGFSVRNQINASCQLMASYLSKPYLYHLDHNTAILLRNVSGGPGTVYSTILVSTFTLMTEMITAATIWLMLVMVDAFTAIVVAGLMGAMMYAIIKAFRRTIVRQGEIQNTYAVDYTKWLNQGLGAIKETKVLRKEEFFLQEYSKAYTKYGGAMGRFSFLNQLPRMIIETFVVSGLLLLIVFKLWLGNSPQDIVPLLGVLALAAFRLMPSANRIVNLYNTIKFAMPLFDEMYEEFQLVKRYTAAHKKTWFSSTGKKLSYQDTIAIRELAFQYPEGQERILNEVSFSIPKGSFAGIIGPSGAGKTTFVDILLGLLQPEQGCITVDGVDIQQDIRAWQANLSYVPQSIYLIDGTIRENIALGILPENIDDVLIEKVLDMAELKDFVAGLPDGSYTTVGERGVKLSGGQRQRIGIARALYQQPEVLILDEATSALDNDTEKSITDTILKLKGQVTIVAIAHRISTLENCDFKIKFDNGTAEVLQ